MPPRRTPRGAHWAFHFDGDEQDDEDEQDDNDNDTADDDESEDNEQDDPPAKKRQRPAKHAEHAERRFNGVGSIFIDPGSPWQNAWIESFNSRLRDELLNSWRDRVVLDPQRPRDLTGVTRDAITTGHLALVCNRAEIRAIGRVR